MALWLVGPEGDPDLAGSAHQRVVEARLEGRPAAPDPGAGRSVIEAAVVLADVCPVLHDVSIGGIAVAAAEVAIRSGVGVQIDPGVDLFGEGPHRFLVAVPADLAHDAITALGASGATHRVIGRFAMYSIFAIMGVGMCLLSSVTLPGGGVIGVYEPRHERPSAG